MTHLRRNWKTVVVALFLALVVLACGEGPSIQPQPTPDLNNVYATDQTRIQQLRATVDAQGK